MLWKFGNSAENDGLTTQFKSRKHRHRYCSSSANQLGALGYGLRHHWIYKGASLKKSGFSFCRITVLLLLVFTTSSLSQETFPVPECIKENVRFWVRIYTEVSLTEGLLHDRDYPQIVYEKVSVGERQGKSRSDYVDGKRKKIASAIQIVRDSSQEKWGELEKSVSNLFKQLPEGALADAENRIRFQTGQRERFKQGLERSSMYLDTISTILKAQGVPEELKYLPHVESSFDPEAYSKAGAAGLWQFMRSTGRNYLKVDYMFDERRDPILSTFAAAKFLKGNFDLLKSWPLAITAYNHGPNGMRKAVAAVGSNDIAEILQKHESATFKFASKNFYSCFLAVVQIADTPDSFFQQIEWRQRFQATSIELPFAVKASTLCKSLGISEQQFKNLNPSLRPVIFSQQKPIPAGYRVNVPHSLEQEAAIALLNKTPTQQRSAPKESESSGYYTVVRGDNLYNIARMLGISMHELAAANNLTRNSKIYVGQVLVIPSTATTEKSVKEEPLVSVSSVKQDTASSESQKQGSAPPDSSVSSSPQQISLGKDSVSSDSTPPQLAVGDTLASAALEEAVPEPKQKNGKPEISTHFDAEVYDLGMTVAPGALSVKIMVAVEETIGHFAEWMAVSAAEIRRMNNLTPGASLAWGRSIQLPIGASSDLKKFEVSRLEYHMAMEEDFFARYVMLDLDKKTIKSGDNLWRICTDAQIPLWLLKKYNRSQNLNNLRPGNQLWIPRVAAKDSHVPPQIAEPIDEADTLQLDGR